MFSRPGRGIGDLPRATIGEAWYRHRHLLSGAWYLSTFVRSKTSGGLPPDRLLSPGADGRYGPEAASAAGGNPEPARAASTPKRRLSHRVCSDFCAPALESIRC